MCLVLRAILNKWNKTNQWNWWKKWTENKIWILELWFSLIHFLSTFLLPDKVRDKEKFCEILLGFLGRKENILGLLIQSRIATIISWSPALTENFSRAPRIAFELTPLDASWITTTLWVSVVIVFSASNTFSSSFQQVIRHKKRCVEVLCEPVHFLDQMTPH